MAAVLTLGGQAATAFVVLILFRAVWHKATAYLQVVGFAQGYGLIPDRLAYPAVRALTGAEALAIVLLALPPTRMAGGLIAALLFAAYAIAMALALRAGRREIDCGCGGAPQIVSGATLARNGVLILLALGAAAAPATPVGALPAAAAILVAVTLWLSLTVAETLDANRALMRGPRPRTGEL